MSQAMSAGIPRLRGALVALLVALAAAAYADGAAERPEQEGLKIVFCERFDKDPPGKEPRRLTRRDVVNGVTELDYMATLVVQAYDGGAPAPLGDRLDGLSYKLFFAGEKSPTFTKKVAAGDDGEPLAGTSYGISLRDLVDEDDVAKLDDSILKVYLEAKDGKEEEHQFRIRIYGFKILMTFGAYSTISDASSGLLSTAKQVNLNLALCYDPEDEDWHGHYLLHLPAIQIESRDRILRNLELGVGVPIELSDDSIFLGFGPDIGILRGPSSRTAIQVGCFFTKDEDYPDNMHFFASIDPGVLMEWLASVQY